MRQLGQMSRGAARLALQGAVLLVAVTVAACAPEVPAAQTDLQRVTRWLEPGAGQDGERPHIIVVSFDALRADALGLYGRQAGTSPHLDRFAEGALVFDRGYTVAPVTPTSFASAFTGLLPHRVFHAWKFVAGDTLAERFSGAGYRTAAFLNNMQLTAERGFDRGFDHYDVMRSVADEEVVRSSVAWLAEEREEPIFAWIHFLSPHSPYDRREMAEHLYDAAYEGRFMESSGSRFEPAGPEEMDRLRQLYDGEVFYADFVFGRLMGHLERLGLLEDSIVVVTSDHGEEFGEHGGVQHDRLTEEHVHVPLMISRPGRDGLRTQILASNLDLFPTLLSLAGITHDAVIEGRDLTRLETTPTSLVGVSMTGSQSRWLSLRKSERKLILTCMPERAAMLFDLAEDPGELEDLSAADRPAVRQFAADLDVIFAGDACDQMNRSVRGVDAAAGLDAETVRTLRALGYL